ncbi:hypothetical protein BQ8482_111248 [Mesorhizobium delmotii]|uniref:Uncharacterized protein n=1 Tax=Mesorhizobium delmotii TaxID=1631247 RepID=A0A2P9ADV1_9HYPH|nr:hypothetical protein BQ8482_111248 [Mesorhizobium delmotii]
MGRITEDRMATGRCLCGGVRYKIAGELTQPIALSLLNVRAPAATLPSWRAASRRTSGFRPLTP